MPRRRAPDDGAGGWTWVEKIQQASIDLGFALPVHGADGSFSDETGSAVVAYKTDRAIFPNDPVVGQRTMASLDAEPALLSTASVQARLAKAEALIGDIGVLLGELSGVVAELRDDL